MEHIFLWSVKLNTLEVRCTFNTIEGILYYLLIIKRSIENPLKNKKNWYNASSRVGRRVELIITRSSPPLLELFPPEAPEAKRRRQKQEEKVNGNDQKSFVRKKNNK